MLIFHFFYPFIVIYYSFLLSLKIDYKYIIIGLTLVFIEILSLGFNAIIFDKYKLLLLFDIGSIVFSLIALILISALWIRSLFPILFISLFWISSNTFYIIWILLCKLEDYFLSVMVFNYNIFFGLAIFISSIILKIKEKLTQESSQAFYIKTFFVLFIQFIIIMLVTFLGFFLGFNESFLSLGIHISSIVIQSFIIIYLILYYIFQLDDDPCCDFSFWKYEFFTTVIFNICFPSFRYLL